MERCGHWRTIGGRRVFIRTGQSLGDAMRESGKFPSYKSKNPKRIKTKDGDVLTKKNDGLDENANIPEYTNYKGDSTLVPDAEKYERVKEDIKGAEGKVYSQGIKGEKERLADEVLSKREKYLKSLDEHDYNNDKWWEENNKLQKDYYDTQDKYDKVLKKYAKQEKGELSWQDKTKLNDIQAEKERKKMEKETPEWQQRSDEYKDKYYGTYREAERKNAQLKVENPSDKYENISAYAGYKDKFDKTWREGTQDKVVSAKMYTNDEFMEHLTDANWHTERRMLESAGLTNKQMEYIKDQVKVTAWGVENLDKKRTEMLINEAKIKYPKEINPTKYSVTSAKDNKKINTMTQEEFNKMPKEYTGELKDLVKTASFRGENPEEIRKKYEKLGYDVDKDKTRLRLDEKNGTILEPVKIVDKSKSIHTQSGSYTKDEINARDTEIKQMYKDTWDGKNSYKELNDKLEAMRKSGKISQGELDSLKYTASREHDISSISKYQNMFNEYKKLHPNTKMDLQKFAKMMMDLG